MMPSSSEQSDNDHASYDELYGVGLLDDLHNYFPALLYEPDEFEGVSDVLNYVASQATRQFDLYSFGREAYLDSVRERRSALMVRSGRQQATLRNQIYSTASDETYTLNPSSSSSSSQEPIIVSLSDRQSRIIQQPMRLNSPLLSQSILTALLAPNFHTTYPPDESRVMTLANLVNLIQTLDVGTGGVGTALPPGFLDPIRIPPSQEQIDAATLTEPVSEQDPGPCSICQDTFQPEQVARTIRYCGHAFHIECIDTWFEQSSTCPTCRYDIREYLDAPNPNPNAVSDLAAVE